MDRQVMETDIVVTGFGPAAAGFLLTLAPELAKTKEDGTPLYGSKAMPGMPLQVMCYERADDTGFGVSGIVTKADAIRATFPGVDLAKEIPNAADVTNIELTLDGERFDLTQGSILDYRRSLNIRTGRLSREVRWRSPAGRVYALCFERVVSLRRLHSIAMKVTVRPEQDTAVKLRSGIDGRMTNDGSQHFSEGQTRSYDDKTVLQFTPRTVQSNIHFVISTVHRFTLDGEAVDPARSLSIVRRRMVTGFTQTLTAGQTLVMEKFATVFTTRDREAEGLTLPELQALGLEQLRRDEQTGFDALAAESAESWAEKVWDRVPIEIDGPAFDLFALRFAQYHM